MWLRCFTIKGGLFIVDRHELRPSVTEAAELRSVGAFSRFFNLEHDSLESLQIVRLGERIESQRAENRNQSFGSNSVQSSLQAPQAPFR